MIYHDFDEKQRDAEKTFARDRDDSILLLSKDPAYTSYLVEVAGIKRQFFDALQREYLPGYELTYKQAATLASIAWDNGHAGGYSDVENEYIDLAYLTRVLLHDTERHINHNKE